MDPACQQKNERLVLTSTTKAPSTEVFLYLMEYKRCYPLQTTITWKDLRCRRLLHVTWSSQRSMMLKVYCLLNRKMLFPSMTIQELTLKMNRSYLLYSPDFAAIYFPLFQSREHLISSRTFKNKSWKVFHLFFFFFFYLHFFECWKSALPFGFSHWKW